MPGVVRHLDESWLGACSECWYLSAPEESESDAWDRLTAHDHYEHPETEGLELDDACTHEVDSDCPHYS